MIAVADASPICYLILIGEVKLPPKLFAKVLVPKAVVDELLDDRAPAPVRGWAAALPGRAYVEQAPAGNRSRVR